MKAVRKRQMNEEIMIVDLNNNWNRSKRRGRPKKICKSAKKEIFWPIFKF